MIIEIKRAGPAFHIGLLLTMIVSQIYYIGNKLLPLFDVVIRYLYAGYKLFLSQKDT